MTLTPTVHLDGEGRLLPLRDTNDVVQAYLGFAFYRVGMPGLALSHLSRVTADRLVPAERRSL